MALTMKVDFKGIQVEAAYIRVSMPTILPGNTSMEFQISYMSGPVAVPFAGSSGVCEYDLEGGNPIKQAYEYLRLQPEFEGCTDC